MVTKNFDNTSAISSSFILSQSHLVLCCAILYQDTLKDSDSELNIPSDMSQLSS